MNSDNIMKAIKSLKPKNCEGHDRIPQGVLIDGMDVLIIPLTRLFLKIYETKTISHQWLIAKVNPILKKGNPSKIDN